MAILTQSNQEESRAALVYLARAADAADRYEDMMQFMRRLLAFPNIELTLEERNLFCVAFKNVTSKLRAGLRMMEHLARHTKPEKKTHLRLIHQERHRISLEYIILCEEVLKIVDEKLLPKASTPEAQIFYYKVRGDYTRYLTETEQLPAKKEPLAESSFDSYLRAHQLAQSSLPATHVTRLGLALNYSVFFYDVRQSPERACHIAKSAFDDAIEELDELTEENYRETVMILQLLRDNLTIWHEELGATEGPTEAPPNEDPDADDDE